MIKILSIGNSFSQDATRYLYGIARSEGEDMKVVNLYIGGCTLSLHYRNMLSEEKAYAFEINGIQNTGIRISLREALLSEDWDVVTLQQQSARSVSYDTFVPYLSSLTEYVRKMSPKARIILHETWGYAEGSSLLLKNGHKTHEEMMMKIRSSYEKAKEAINADGVILSGEAILEANRQGLPHIFRDDRHMSYGFGRLLLGLVWYRYFVDAPIDRLSFRDFDEPISEEEIARALQITKLLRARKKFFWIAD